MFFISDPVCQQHEMGTGHPECPERLLAIEAELKRQNLWTSLDHLPAPSATTEQIQLAHQHDYIQSIVDHSPVEGYCSLDADTTMNPHSLNAALKATGANLLGIDRIMSKGDCQQAFCSVRPPGHHAENNRAMGFCLFNHIAVAAFYAHQHYDARKIVIIDFDVHHGNGTEEILANQPFAKLISTFQHPLYPGSGIPASAPNIVNFPLAAGTDSVMIQTLWTQQIIPTIEHYQPELILVSAGFDAHRDDPLAQLNFADEDYFFFGKHLQQLANAFCHGRLLATLEGGYALDALGRSVAQFIRGIMAAR